MFYGRGSCYNRINDLRSIAIGSAYFPFDDIQDSSRMERMVGGMRILAKEKLESYHNHGTSKGDYTKT